MKSVKRRAHPCEYDALEVTFRRRVAMVVLFLIRRLANNGGPSFSVPDRPVAAHQPHADEHDHD